VSFRFGFGAHDLIYLLIEKRRILKLFQTIVFIIITDLKRNRSLAAAFADGPKCDVRLSAIEMSTSPGLRNEDGRMLLRDHSTRQRAEIQILLILAPFGSAWLIQTGQFFQKNISRQRDGQQHAHLKKRIQRQKKSRLEIGA
jgi:hypothetical protein